MNNNKIIEKKKIQNKIIFLVNLILELLFLIQTF
jgi:hypothetical protein